VLLVVVILFLLLVLASYALATHAYAGGADPVSQPRRFPRAVSVASRAAADVPDYSLFEVAPGRVSFYSSLMPWHVPDVDHAFRDFYAAEPPPRSIVDATAHIGADSVNFMKLFPTAALTSVEIDPTVAAILKKNVSFFAAKIKKRPPPRVVCADAAAYCLSAPASDMAYLDPPWESERWRAEGPSLGDEPLGPFVHKLLKNGTRAVFVKLPRDADLDAFDASVGLVGARYPVRDGRPDRLDRAGPSYWLMAYR
jgi:hypothetical protein